MEVITQGGNVQPLVPSEIKAICFISEGGTADLFTSNSLFERRPKLPGLWARFTFRDGEKLDGILPHNLIDWPQEGYLLIPPRVSPTRQRVFVPRSALLGTECRGIIGKSASRLRGRSESEVEQEEQQLAMFDPQP
jgi:hypothetical protein